MSIATGLKRYFTLTLMQWHETGNMRSLPWKHETDAYKIWLSEILLQQTRAEQGLPYYHAFVKKYPAIKMLAAAPDEEVFKLWQGLGYYSRCRNLLKAARIIVNDYNGKMPDEYQQVIALPGIGAYTASAIMSFAFGQPYAVVDGNVYRVLARFFGIDIPVDSSEGKKLFTRLANELIDKESPAAFNQAIMDYGAVVCKPQQPLCGQCMLSDKCMAYKSNMITSLPVKEKKLQIKSRHFHYFLLKFKGEIFIQQRLAKDIWQHLFELYLIESDDIKIQKELSKQLGQTITNDNIKAVFHYKQKLTHQLIHSSFYEINLKKRLPDSAIAGRWVKPDELRNFAFPKTILSFFHQKDYF